MEREWEEMGGLEKYRVGWNYLNTVLMQVIPPKIIPVLSSSDKYFPFRIFQDFFYYFTTFKCDFPRCIIIYLFNSLSRETFFISHS